MKTDRSPLAVRLSSQRSKKAGFRWHLKEATYPQHEELDTLISGLDLTREADLVRFFKLHFACFTAMASVRQDRTLMTLIEALREDLVLLGYDHQSVPSVRIPSYHPLAGKYLLSGSRMQTKVLKKRWLQMADPIVRTAGNYFSLDMSDHGWTEVCASLNEVDQNSQLAKDIIADTQQLFSAFLGAGRYCRELRANPTTRHVRRSDVASFWRV